MQAVAPRAGARIETALTADASAVLDSSLPVPERGSKQGQIDRGHRAPGIAPAAQIETHALVPDEPSWRLNRDGERVITKVVAVTRNHRYRHSLQVAI
jgi:hypothetical protein